MDKKLFIETVEALQKQYECASGVFHYQNLINQVVKILQVEMNDKQNWVEYYIRNLDFGKNYKLGDVKIRGLDFELKTPEDLWDLLIIS